MLYLHHSNRLTLLFDQLMACFAQDRIAVFQAHQVLVQNPGMKRWLQLQIRLRDSIAANLHFPLPSRFIWDVFSSQFAGIEDLSAYDADQLRWSLFKLLDEPYRDTSLKWLQTYLERDQDGRMRFQLAQKLADLFDQYLVYRPQMITGWEKGQSESQDTDEQWQMLLWRQCRDCHPQAHRVRLIERLIMHLRDGHSDRQRLPENLYVFAISALSPLYTDVFAELAKLIDVHFFILNPCEHYWGDLQDRRELAHRNLDEEPGNQLLASLGKQGRDFIDQFYQRDYACEDHHLFEPIEPDNLLQALQQQILTLSPNLDWAVAADDESITIVSCYSEMRELQVLHDRLLGMLETFTDLTVDDIVVMCPQIDQLAPYIDAVFGQQPDDLYIPYAISDQSSLSESALLQTLLQLLDLPNQRLTGSQILSWLELPALRRNYSLDSDMLEIIRHWVRDNQIRWGLDGRHKQRLGLGESGLNTWRHGLARLLTAYLMADETEVFADQVAASALISQEEYHALGQLQRLLDDLSYWSGTLASAQTVEDWQSTLNRLIDQMFSLDPDDEWQLKPLRDEMARWLRQTGQAGFDGPIHAALVRQLLDTALSQGVSHHHYLTGAVNFCNLIPMRSLPFRVVCLIGFGEDRFPRQQPAPWFDLIARYPQIGDRSRREDDRYMFLQSLLSANDRLYISYVGNDRQDDSEIQPSVVINELIDHIEEGSGHRLAITRSTLQPFSAENFRQGSYARRWQIDPRETQRAEFNQILPGIDKPQQLTIDQLRSFYRNPAAYYLKHRLNLSLDDYDESLEETETFALEPLKGYSIRRRMLEDLIETGQISDRRYLLSGELAPGNAGRIQLDQLARETQERYQQMLSLDEYQGAIRHALSVDIGGQTLTGPVESFSRQVLLQVKPARVSGGNLFDFWIQYNVASLAGQAQSALVLFYDRTAGLRQISPKQAHANLKQMLYEYYQGLNTPLAFLPQSAFDYLQKKSKDGESAASQWLLEQWQDDSPYRHNDTRDVYVRRLFGDRGIPLTTFIENSERLMQPLLDVLEVRR